jgi:hypothetical protein
MSRGLNVPAVVVRCERQMSQYLRFRRARRFGSGGFGRAFAVLDLARAMKEGSLVLLGDVRFTNNGERKSQVVHRIVIVGSVPKDVLLIG